MKTKSIFIIAIAFVAVSLTSCKKDKEDPTISVVEPDDHQHFIWGEEVHVEANFTDDQALKSYDVSIQDDAGNISTDFNFHYTGDLEGATGYFHEHAIVPDSCMSMGYVSFTISDMEDKTVTEKRMVHFDPQ